jgi:acyl-CoA thioester hydrolase
MGGHVIEVKVYYEDTDSGGVVYYANYLKYFERARTEYLEEKGISIKELMEEGILFAVTEASLRYHRPGVYGDILNIETAITGRGRASLVFSHQVIRKNTGELLVSGSVKIASVSDAMRPVRLPQRVSNLL